MSFVVTARKWRPQKFSEVVGQEHITSTLKNAIKNNRIAHAYLFTGPRGVGKTTTARILAKSLNCLNPKDAEPCNECEQCKAIQTAQSLDIIEIDGASNRGIDEIRSLRESVKYAPTKGAYKVYIIDEVHMLTRESFNAFLKTLEEPPSHTIFIFATTDVHKVPLTIISRCQRFDFRRIQLDEIKETLAAIAKSEKIEIDDKTLTIIAKKADGALRDAESFFDQVVSYCGQKIESETVAQMLNLIDDGVYFKLSDAIINKDFKSVFDISNEIYENGWNFIDFMDGLIEHFRNIMTVILTAKVELVETADVNKKRYMEYVDQFSHGDIIRLLNYLSKLQQELRFAQNPKLKIEIALTHLIGLEKSSTITEILNNIDSGNAKTEAAGNPKPVSQKSEPAPPTKKKVEPIKTSFKVEEEPPAPLKIKLTPSEEEEEFNFNTVVSKWQNFIDSVNAEKGLIFGPLMKKIELQNLNGNRLSVATNDSHVKEIVDSYKGYLDKKTLDYFGRKLTFDFTIKEKELPKPDKKFRQPEKKQKEENPLVKVILDELGGEEI